MKEHGNTEHRSLEGSQDNLSTWRAYNPCNITRLAFVKTEGKHQVMLQMEFGTDILDSLGLDRGSRIRLYTDKKDKRFLRIEKAENYSGYPLLWRKNILYSLFTWEFHDILCAQDFFFRAPVYVHDEGGIVINTDPYVHDITPRHDFAWEPYLSASKKNVTIRLIEADGKKKMFLRLETDIAKSLGIGTSGRYVLYTGKETGAIRIGRSPDRSGSAFKMSSWKTSLTLSIPVEDDTADKKTVTSPCIPYEDGFIVDVNGEGEDAVKREKSWEMHTQYRPMRYPRIRTDFPVYVKAYVWLKRRSLKIGFSKDILKHLRAGVGDTIDVLVSEHDPRYFLFRKSENGNGVKIDKFDKITIMYNFPDEEAGYLAVEDFKMHEDAVSFRI